MKFQFENAIRRMVGTIVARKGLPSNPCVGLISRFLYTNSFIMVDYNLLDHVMETSTAEHLDRPDFGKEVAWRKTCVSGVDMTSTVDTELDDTKTGCLCKQAECRRGQPLSDVAEKTLRRFIARNHTSEPKTIAWSCDKKGPILYIVSAGASYCPYKGSNHRTRAIYMLGYPDGFLMIRCWDPECRKKSNGFRKESCGLRMDGDLRDLIFKRSE